MTEVEKLLARDEPEPPSLPAQNRNVLSFKPTPEGRIAIDATALADRLRTDQGAQDRHAEAVGEAQALLDRCDRNNAGERLTRLLKNYLAATGNTLEDAKPSMIVQRGERLRQELAAYENPDNFLAPLPDDLLLDLKGWLTAHNMMVGLDPVLNAADLAMLGPDRQPALIPPVEISEKVQQADDAGILDEGVAETIQEAVWLAPEIPDPNDRRTLWSVEVARNLVVESFAIAINHPVLTGGLGLAGKAIYESLGAGGLGAISVLGAIKAAEYLVTHRDWILCRLGNTPTWQALFKRVAEWLEANTPFDPK